jgi:hypothetical protein
MYIPFDQLPTHSRIWVYQAERGFSSQEKELISTSLKQFCEGWNTHGNLMPTSFQILEEQFIVLGVDESSLGASGCSIDGSVRTLRELEKQLEINLTDQGKVSFKNNAGQVAVYPALGIKSKVLSGEIERETLVLNPLVKIKKDLENVWISANESWLNKYFPN